MKFLYITQIYEHYYQTFISKLTNIRELSYNDLLIKFQQDGFSWNGCWELPLNQHGYEVKQIICNADILQKKWLNENTKDKNLSNTEITKRQVLKYKPNVVFLATPREYNHNWIKYIKETCNDIKLILIHCGTNSYDIDTLKSSDLVLTCINTLACKFNQEGCNSYHFMHAYNSSLKYNKKKYDRQNISFCGSVSGYLGEFSERNLLLKNISKNFLDLELCTPSYNNSLLGTFTKLKIRQFIYILFRLSKNLGLDYLKHLPFIWKADRWGEFPTFPFEKDLYRYFKPSVYGIDLYEKFFSSFINLNIHISDAGDEAANCRLFEVTGAESLLLTDFKKNLSNIFEIDSEVVSYSSIEECIEKINFLTNYPSHRDTIATNGRKRVLSDHTYFNRAEFLNDIICFNI